MVRNLQVLVTGALLILLLWGGLSEGGACSKGWTRFRDSCFVFINTSTTWSNAQSICETQGGNLAVIKSKKENEKVAELIPTISRTVGCWIGLNDLVTEGRFLWLGEDREASFTNWYPGQPDNAGSENCAVIWFNGTWNDVNCVHNRRFICEA